MEDITILEYETELGEIACRVIPSLWWHNFAPRFGENAKADLVRCIKAHKPDAIIWES